MLLLRLLAIAAVAWIAWRLIVRVRGVPGDAAQRCDAPMSAEHQLEQWLQQTDRAIEQARHWTNSEVALGVESYVLQRADDEGLLLGQLMQQRPRAAALALEMLESPAQLARLRRRKGRETGLHRALRLVALQPAAAALPFLCELLDGPDDAGRAEAAQWLAATPGDRAFAELAARGILAAEHVNCEPALRGLHGARRSLPRRMLLQLWQRLPDRSYEARRLTLLLLANHRDERDRALFERVATESEECGDTAAQCLAGW